MRPSGATKKIDGQEMPFSASYTPKARATASFSSARMGKVTPSFFASSADFAGASTEMATSVAPRLFSSGRLFCSSPSCVRQNGHQKPR